MARYEFLGELALSSALLPVRGAIPAALAAAEAGRRLILSADNGHEVGLIAQGETLGAQHLLEVCAFLLGRGELQIAIARPTADTQQEPANLQDIVGQGQTKRALKIAAVGGHNLLLIRPPVTGKTILASRLTCLLSPVNRAGGVGKRGVNQPAAP